MQLQFAEILMYQQKHYKVLRNELWDFWRSFLQISEQENHQEKLQTDGPKTKNEFYECYVCFQSINQLYWYIQLKWVFIYQIQLNLIWTIQI